MQPTTSTASSSKSAPSNNQSAVAALLRSRLNSGVAPTDVYSPQYVPLRGTYQPAARTAPKPQHAAPVASSSTTPPPGCPMHVDGASQSTPSALPSKPPSSSPWSSTLNPLNYMPSLSQSRAEKQETELPTERVRSSIPRAPTSPGRGASPYDAPSSCPVAHAADAKAAPTDAEGENWEYPSAQQFYNALVRKGWETPEEHVEMMVLVHNFLNERAWTEVLEWERDMGSEPSKVSLAKFQGRPGTLSPKARIFGWLGVIAPSKFNSEPPFDRHDWVVRRPAPRSDAEPHDVRYIIDYYACPDDEETGEPVFNLDIRPALDSWEAAMARMKRGWSEWNGEGATGQAGTQGKQL